MITLTGEQPDVVHSGCMVFREYTDADITSHLNGKLKMNKINRRTEYGITHPDILLQAIATSHKTSFIFAIIKPKSVYIYILNHIEYKKNLYPAVQFNPNRIEWGSYGTHTLKK